MQRIESKSMQAVKMLILLSLSMLACPVIPCISCTLHHRLGRRWMRA